MFLESFTILHANDVEMIHRTRPVGLVRRDQTVRCRREQPVISLRSLLSPTSPNGEVSKLDREDSRLDRIETSVVTLYVVVILLRLSVIAQHANLASDLFIVCCDRSGLTACPQ